MITDTALDPTQLLRQLEIACRQERSAQNKKLIMAAGWADCHPADSIDPAQLRVSGGERPIHPGGDGTPAIAGFCVAELGATLRMSIGSATRFIGDALDIRHRLPRLWSRLCQNEIDGWQAQRIARETHHLSAAQAILVDASIADQVGRQAWSATLRSLDAKIIEVDAARIADLAAAQRTAKGVWFGDADEHGQKTIFARADAPDVIWFDAMTDRIARILQQHGDGRRIDERRAAAIGILANPAYALRLLAEDVSPTLFDEEVDLGKGAIHSTDPAPDTDPADADPTDPSTAGPADEQPNGAASTPSVTPAPPPRFPVVDHELDAARAAIRAISEIDPSRLRPDAKLYVHIAAETLRQGGLGVTRVEELGPIVAGLVRGWLGGCTVTVRPVIDLNGEPAPVDAYEIPARMREQVFLRRPTSIFPYSAGVGRRLDVDHTDPYRPGIPGQTKINKLGPIDRTGHRIVTHSCWRRRQPEPGTYLFRAPHGSIYLVNGSGTHDLGHDQFARTIWHAAAPE